LLTRMSRTVACNDAEADPCKCRKARTKRDDTSRFSTVSCSFSKAHSR